MPTSAEQETQQWPNYQPGNQGPNPAYRHVYRRDEKPGLLVSNNNEHAKHPRDPQHSTDQQLKKGRPPVSWLGQAVILLISTSRDRPGARTALALDFPVAPADAVRFVPVDFRFISFACVFLNGCDTFILRQRRPPCRRRNACLAWTPRPDAMALICRISPRMAKELGPSNQCPFPKNVLIES